MFCAVFLFCATTAIAAPAQTFTTLVNFDDGNDGGAPLASLIQATDGNFYGTTAAGGAYNDFICNGEGCGTVFKITPAGTLTTLYSFCAKAGCPDGTGPRGLVLGANGNFYGITEFGGTCTSEGGCGTVFKITPGGTTDHALRLLYPNELP